MGYEMEAPMSTFYQLPEENQEISLYMHLVVREDALQLFGFSDQRQRELFRNLLKVNGVGPRVGLAILSTLSIDEFVGCVRRQDLITLTRVPGIGKKTAERMIIDMRDRISNVKLDDTDDVTVTQPADAYQDAIGALIFLGYRANDAARAVESVRDQGDSRDELIKNALRLLAKR